MGNPSGCDAGEDPVRWHAPSQFDAVGDQLPVPRHRVSVLVSGVGGVDHSDGLRERPLIQLRDLLSDAPEPLAEPLDWDDEAPVDLVNHVCAHVRECDTKPE